ncbi:uncharacterized protein LOC110683801 [Chenopodium quinoa]|uniref:uncharacterized protein LOC110683801 n=1 Tax=Chenopodium quinoa TaxID=63459 RepID=UPI000B7723B7|nr:uncharacterized protein LOC110683801 [Chenopodium quinoa]
MWNDLTAPKYFDKLSNWAETFKVNGFRALKPNTRCGFSMNSGMSTRIVYEPKGNRATVLSDWANLFYQRVVDRQARVLEIRYPSENKKILSIAELRQKKPSNTLQEEVLWIEVTIENAELEKVNAYTGCSNCWKRTNLPLQKRYSCVACSNKEYISTERITFKFEARDDIGTMAFTTFNDDTERLFRKTAATIYAIKEAADQDAFKAIQDMLSSTPFYIKVGPTRHLGQNNVLEWTLKTIELKESLDTEQNIQDTVTNTDQGKDSMEKHSENTVVSGPSEPFIPTPKMKKSSEEQTEASIYTEIATSPQESAENLKRKKSLGKSPMESGDQETDLELQTSQTGAKKKLCFGGMTQKNHTKGQNPGISLGREGIDDVPQIPQPQQKLDTPVIVKTEKVKKTPSDTSTKET